MPEAPRDTVVFVESGTILFDQDSDAVALARGRGLRVAVLGAELSPGSALAADVPVLVRDLDDPSAPLETLLKGRVAAVIALDDDAVRATGTLAAHPRFAALAGGRAEPLRRVVDFMDKARLRARLAEREDLAVPFRHVAEPDAAAAAVEEIGVPCVVKPAVGSNSQFVYYCEDAGVAEEAVRRVLEGPGQASGALVEPFLSGPEFSVEAFTLGGETTVVAVCRKVLGPLPYFVEVGHSLRRDAEGETESQVARTAVEVLRHLEVDGLVTHTEVRLTDDGPRVVEVNPRPPGGRMRELVLTVTGVDLLDAALSVALGEPPAASEPRAAAGIYDCITAPHPAVFLFNVGYVRWPLPVGVLPTVEVDVLPGAEVHPVNDEKGRILGRILAYGQTPDEAAGEAERIRRELTLFFIPLDPAAQPVPSATSSPAPCGCGPAAEAEAKAPPATGCGCQAEAAPPAAEAERVGEARAEPPPPDEEGGATAAELPPASPPGEEEEEEEEEDEAPAAGAAGGDRRGRKPRTALPLASGAWKQGCC